MTSQHTKRSVTRNQICQHLDLGLPSPQHCEKCLFEATQSMVFRYGSSSSVKILSLTSMARQGMKVRRDIPECCNPEYPRVPSLPQFLRNYLSGIYQVSAPVPGTGNTADQGRSLPQGAGTPKAQEASSHHR